MEFSLCDCYSYYNQTLIHFDYSPGDAKVEIECSQCKLNEIPQF